MLQLQSEVQFVKGVGPKRGGLLRARGIQTVKDLLFCFPRCYQDRAHFAPLESLQVGTTYTCHAKVHSIHMIPTRSRGRIMHVVFSDGSSFVHAKWFNGDHLYRNKTFVPGQSVVFFGRADTDKYDRGVVFLNPEFEIVLDIENVTSRDMGRYVGIYSEIAGISPRQLRTIIGSALDALPDTVHDPLPAGILKRRTFPGLHLSLERIHRPTLEDNLGKLNDRLSRYHQRFIFEEFFLLELTLALRRHRFRSTKGIHFETNESIRNQLKRILPFHPTRAQKRAFKEIVDDLRASFPMNRLLQGDVGCGKTIVAFESIVVAIENGFQSVIMAPTEILAEQHYINARRILGQLNYSIGLLKRTLPKADKGKLLKRIQNGEIQLVIGTHAILEETAVFENLGLVIVDEQHRFGVMQRLRLMEKGRNPNTLVMTATPIPRTLAMTLYGDLDISVIDEMPPGRSPIKTVHYTEHFRESVYQVIDKHVSSGRQCYVVYPVIEDSEKLDLLSATEGFECLSRFFRNYRIGLLHGRMKGEEKESVMKDFSAGKIEILVATTVVEVGVDVANATVMLIEHAERFGIAQLHQLRGRVGRGNHSSECLLMTPDRISDIAKHRVGTVATTTDGFKLAETDLRIRGPGEVAGTRQSGIPEFRLANLLEHGDLLSQARDEAGRCLDDFENLEPLIERLGRRSGIGDLVTVG